MTLSTTYACATTPDQALAGLLAWLDDDGYDFVTPTPATHARVLRRRGGSAVASDARDVLGWSLPFRRADLPPPLTQALEAAGALAREGDLLRSRIRVSRLRGRLYIHSAYPTDAPEAVFLGPDSYRFADFVTREVAPDFQGLAVDVGAGCGPGALALVDHAPGAEVLATDLNAQALRYARVAARHAGRPLRTAQAEGLADTPAPPDLVIANPPYMAASAQAYRDGGGRLGEGLSLRWAAEALDRLAPGGRMLLYSGSPILAGGQDRLRTALSTLCADRRASLDYRELDPDVFGEELDREAYAGVERIAAIGCVIACAS